MKTLLIPEVFKYDGTQLRPLFAYMNFGLLGDSAVAWIGPCNIHFDEMVDGEDQRSESEIRGDEMLHFILEVFDRDLAGTVLLQRLFASIIKDLLMEKSPLFDQQPLVRDGDDLYWGDRKLSISIASKSAVSTQLHFAVNIINSGTPVKTCALTDFKVDPKEFASEALAAIQLEWEGVLDATRKVHPL